MKQEGNRTLRGDKYQWWGSWWLSLQSQCLFGVAQGTGFVLGRGEQRGNEMGELGGQ